MKYPVGTMVEVVKDSAFPCHGVIAAHLKYNLYDVRIGRHGNMLRGIPEKWIVRDMSMMATINEMVAL